jgi:hypothetical protein
MTIAEQLYKWNHKYQKSLNAPGGAKIKKVLIVAPTGRENRTFYGTVTKKQTGSKADFSVEESSLSPCHTESGSVTPLIGWIRQEAGGVVGGGLILTRMLKTYPCELSPPTSQI